MKIHPEAGRWLILSAWALYLLALFLPAVDVDLIQVPRLVLIRLKGYEAAIFSLSIITGFAEEPSLRALWFMLIPFGNLALIVCPLELLVHRHLRRMALPVTLLSAFALVCVALLPFTGAEFSARHAGHYLMLSAFAVLAVGNIALVQADEDSPDGRPAAPLTRPRVALSFRARDARR